MLHSILLFLHISGGLVAIPAGMAALFPRKGSRLHIIIGSVFFYSMIVMTVTATYMAIFHEGSWINSIAGSTTFYMVMTGRRALTNKSGKRGLLEIAGAIYILIIIAILVPLIIDVTRSGPKQDGVYVAAYYMFALMTSVALTFDVKLIVKGGVYGAQRIARHLGRMLVALYVATASFFLGQPQVFPEFITEEIRFIPVIVVIVTLIFWTIRVYLIRRFKLKSG